MSDLVKKLFSGKSLLGVNSLESTTEILGRNLSHFSGLKNSLNRTQVTQRNWKFLSWPDLRILCGVMAEGSAVGELAEVLRRGMVDEIYG